MKPQRKKQKNKFIFAILILGCLTFLASGVLAESLVYVTKDSSNIDQNILDILIANNYEYDIVFDNQIQSTNFSNYDLMIIEDGNFGNNALLIPVNQVNSIILNTKHLEQWNWMSSGIGSISSTRPKEVIIYDNQSSIVENSGINSSFFPYEYGDVQENYKFYYISKNKDASGVMTVVADGLSFLQFFGIYVVKNGAVVATVEKGGELRNNNISNARGVFFGFEKTYLWTEEVEQMFLNSIQWGIYGGDRDNDGFLSEFDCNDSDPNINPNAIEIAYDGIDQDCDGFDLTDVDEDGFDSFAVGGEDCDDNDPTINPNSTDLAKNCINDAPEIDYISKIYVYETENATLIINAVDYEGDEITYWVNDTRFVRDSEQSNVFHWNTDYTDEGYYEFFAYAGDEFSNNASLVFKVYVWNKNKYPELLMDIPEQIWNEDENHTLNLTEYFFDLDGDDLYYLFGESSDDTNIEVKEIVDGVVTFEVQENWFGEDWIIFRITDLINTVYSNNITLRVLPVNDEPYMVEDSVNITLWENQDYTIDLNDYFFDVDGDLNYTYQADDIEFEFDAQDKSLRIIPDQDWHGQREFQVQGSDQEYNVHLNVNLEVVEVVYPDIEILNPENDSLFNNTRSVEFSFKVWDKITNEFNCNLIVDEQILDSLIVLNDTETNFSYSFTNDGIYSWKVECENLQGNLVSSESWDFEISAPDSPVLNPITSKQVNENQTLSFEISGYDPDKEDVSFTAGNLPSGAVFKDNGDGTASFSWQTNYELSGFYYPEFTIHDTTARSASQKVTIRVVDVKEPPKFEDAKQCKGEDYDGMIEIKIREPDYNDDFEIGDIIEVEFEIENNFDDDVKFEYEVHLYDLNEEESLDKIKGKIKIDEDDDEKIELEMEIPDDFQDSEFAVYLYVEGEDLCNSEFVEIEIERKKHDVKIKRIKVEPDRVEPGENMNIIVEVENLGTSDEDVVIEIEIPALNLKDGSDEFEIEEFGEDDSEREKFVITIPQEFKEGSYDLIARVFYDNEEEMDEKKSQFVVLNRETKIYEQGFQNNSSQDSGVQESNLIILSKSDGESKITGSVIQLTEPENNNKVSKKSIAWEKTQREKINPLGSIIAILVIGIVVLIILIYIVLGKR